MPEKVFSTRIDDELQREFRSIVVRKGLTVSSVIVQLMCKYIELEGGTVPQAVKTREDVEPNVETIVAMAELERGGGKPFATVAELMADLSADDEFDDPIEKGNWNAETMAALREIEEGGIIRFNSAEELFAYLKS